MPEFIPVPPAPWVPTSTDSESKLFPAATMAALAGEFAGLEAGKVPEGQIPARLAEANLEERFAGLDEDGAVPEAQIPARLSEANLESTIGSVGNREFLRRNRVRPKGYTPEFADAGITLYTQADMGFPSMYSPQLYDMSVDPTWTGPRWISANSTDHDDAPSAFGGLGGICIMKRDADSPYGPFTSHRVSSNPVIYRDTTAGNQTEWPRFFYVPEDPDGKPHYMYYSQSGVGVGQSTLLAKTANPLDPASYVRVGIVMQGRDALSNGSRGPGDGQTTYADPFAWGESIGMVTIDGGGSLAGAKIIHRSDDGIKFTRNPNRIADRTDLTGDTELRFVYGTPFRWRGEWWATFSRSPWGSGLWSSTDVRPYVAKVSSDLLSIISKPYPMLPGNTLPAGVTELGNGIPIEYSTTLVAAYRANGRFGHARAYWAEA